MTPPVPIEA